MDVMDVVNDSDGEFRTCFGAVLEKLKEGEYKKDELNKKSPDDSGEASGPLRYYNRVVVIDNYKILNIQVSALK